MALDRDAASASAAVSHSSIFLRVTNTRATERTMASIEMQRLVQQENQAAHGDEDAVADACGRYRRHAGKERRRCGTPSTAKQRPESTGADHMSTATVVQ